MIKKVNIRIHYNQTSFLIQIIVILMTTTFLITLVCGQQEVHAVNPQVPQAVSVGVRQFYLAKNLFSGSEALTACADGYHMASFWEISDTSNLRYNITLGVTLDDSGQGPPAAPAGWVRTGYSSDNSRTAGMGNCNAWTSDSSENYGTVIYLPYADWNVGSDVGTWRARTFQCDQSWRVWCVTDKWDVGYTVYLPIVLRH